MNKAFGADRIGDEVLLAGRILLMILFVLFGYEKAADFGGTMGNFGHMGVPMPELSVPAAIFMELLVGLAIVLGLFTRPLAILLAAYTLATAVLGHHFWTLTGRAALEAEINFFKNISIIGGLLLLYVTGPGRLSLDQRLGLA